MILPLQIGLRIFQSSIYFQKRLLLNQTTEGDSIETYPKHVFYAMKDYKNERKRGKINGEASENS
jgi:hypothetical protein